MTPVRCYQNAYTMHAMKKIEKLTICRRLAIIHYLINGSCALRARARARPSTADREKQTTQQRAQTPSLNARVALLKNRHITIR